MIPGRTLYAARMAFVEQLRRPLLMIFLVVLPFFFITRAISVTLPIEHLPRVAASADTDAAGAPTSPTRPRPVALEVSGVFNLEPLSSGAPQRRRFDRRGFGSDTGSSAANVVVAERVEQTVMAKLSIDRPLQAIRVSPSRLRGVIVVLLLLLVPLLAIGALLYMNHFRDQRIAAGETLAAVATEVDEISAGTGWTIATDAPSGPALADVASARARIHQMTGTLEDGGVSREVTAALLARIDTFLNDLSDALAVDGSTGGQASRQVSANQRALADYGVIDESIAATTTDLQGAATWSERIFEVGASLAIIAASLTLVSLMWFHSRRRHRMAVNEATRDASAERERDFRLLFEGNPQPMWVSEAETYRFLAVNEAAIAHYGYSKAEFLAMTLMDVLSADEPSRLEALLLQRTPGARRSVGVWQHRTKAGRTIHVEVDIDDLVFGGRPARLAAVHDVTDRMELERELRHRAFHDSLTGLPNRELFVDRFGQAQLRRERDRGRMAVMVVDADGFKAINDSFGHSVGDSALKEMATRIRSALRASDTVARLGGDEFAVLMEDGTGFDPHAAARRVLDNLGEPYHVGAASASLGASIGVTVVDAQETSDGALRKADAAMYTAKQSGRSFAVYDADTQIPALRRIHAVTELRVALERVEFTVVYQPIVELRTGGDLLEVEALVRWRHPRRGLLAPAEFISVAEESGLIVPLGAWVLNRACEDAVAWTSRLGRPVNVSVNVSPRQLREHGFVEEALATLRRSGLAETQLILEVTESALLDDVADACRQLRELRGHGVRIALDDFGTGYSSLAYLRDLPLDIVKIDRSFVQHIDAREGDTRPLIDAVVRVLDGLPVTVVVEGLETASQVAYVRSLGIEAGQGFFLGMPVDAESTFERFLKLSRSRIAVG